MIEPALATSTRRQRLDSLTGLRWWAAFAVFLFHMANLAPLPVNANLRIGDAGVTFFFVLSGFVLTWSAKRATPARTFWVRRFARIWPAHMVALLLAIPVFYSFDPDPAQWWVKPVSIGVLLLSVPLLQGWSRDPAILFSGNPAAWTLTCEAFFYALHPFINRGLGALRTRGAAVVVAAAFVLALGYRTTALLVPGFDVVPLPVVRLTEFVIGMGIAQLVASRRLRLPHPMLAYGLIIAVYALLPTARQLAAGHPRITFLLGYTNEFFIVLCALAILLAANHEVHGGRARVLGSRLLVWLGDVSYAFYLVHGTVIYALRAHFGQQGGGWAVNLAWTAVALALSLACAAALHHLVERPVERRIRRWWDARMVRRAAPHHIEGSTGPA